MEQKNNRFTEEKITPDVLKFLQDTAKDARVDILTMTTLANSGHPGGSMSSLEVFLTLFYFLNINPDNADTDNRDYVVVSHGHTSPGVYATLGRLGFFDIDEAIAYFRKAGSPYEGHIERHLKGVDWSTGNLGQGLSAGCGFALSAKLKKKDSLVFVVMGDGEQQKGQLTEARRFARKFNLNNLFAIVDVNKLQISGTTDFVMKQNLKENYLSDGWDVYETDGHDFNSIYNTIRTALTKGGPAVILAHTVMGKGVSFMENIKDYHGKALTKEQFKEALQELGCENKLAYYEDLRKNKKFEAQYVKAHSLFPKLQEPQQKIYEKDKKIDMRSAFGEALVETAKANLSSDFLPFAVFDCDLASSVKVDGFAKLFSENFFESGIQEHNTCTIAGAVSTQGLVSVFADFGVFGVDEVYNQQRLNDINNTNLKVVCTHLGVDVGEDGKTHQCIDYLGLLRNLFGFRVVMPADANQTFRVVTKELATPGNVFIGMGRSVTPIITKEDGTPFFDEKYRYEYGKWDILRKGKDVAILTYGVMVYRAINISEILKESGISVMVVNASSPKQIDENIMDEVVKIGKIVTYEDHNSLTGLGSIISDHLFEKGVVCQILKLGVENYCFSGATEEVFEMIGLSAEKAAQRIKKFYTNPTLTKGGSMDLLKDEALVKKLVNENEEFRKLYEEHLELKSKIAEFDNKHYITPEEELERKRLQKIKLAGKDRMFEILKEYKNKNN